MSGTQDDYNKTRSVDVAIVQKAINMLSQQFDTVQIFVTRHDGADKGTLHIEQGNGNWYARAGQVRMWLDSQYDDSFVPPGDRDDDNS